MANTCVKAVLITLLVLFIILELSEARRGGGGGFRSRSSRSVRSSRVRSSYRSKYSSYRLSSKSSIRNAILLGTVYGATRWKVRRSYRSDSSRLPEICYNDNYVKSDTGNVSYYGRFVCPLDETMGDDYSYCCGDEGKQFCCGFWDNGGRVAGVVIGIIILAIIVFVSCFCLYKHCRGKGSRGSVFKSGSHNSGPTKGFTSKSEYSAVYSPPQQLQTNAYSTQPAGYTSDPVMPPPPSYDTAAGNGALPYDVNPVKQQIPVSPAESLYPYNSEDYKAPLPTNDTADGLPYPVNPQTGYPPAGYPPAAYPPSGGSTAPPYPIN